MADSFSRMRTRNHPEPKHRWQPPRPRDFQPQNREALLSQEHEQLLDRLRLAGEKREPPTWGSSTLEGLLFPFLDR